MSIKTRVLLFFVIVFSCFAIVSLARADSYGIFPPGSVTIGGYLNPGCIVLSNDESSIDCFVGSKPDDYNESSVPADIFPQEDIYVLSSKLTWAQNSATVSPSAYATIGCQAQVTTFWNWIDAFLFSSTNYVNGLCLLSDDQQDIYVQNSQPEDEGFPFVMFTMTYIPVSAYATSTEVLSHDSGNVIFGISIIVFFLATIYGTFMLSIFKYKNHA